MPTKKFLYTKSTKFLYTESTNGPNIRCRRKTILRLVSTRAVARALPPARGREGGGSGAVGGGRAVAVAPGGSGRYRPATARAGGEREAGVGREAGGAVAAVGERGAGDGREGGRQAREGREGGGPTAS